MQTQSYLPLPSTENGPVAQNHGKGHSRSIWKYLFILVGAILYVFPLLYTVQHMYHENAPNGYARTISLSTKWKKIWWNTKYSPQNHTDSDQLWDEINPAHGFIAVDRQWAADNHWPDSMYLPDDQTKGVYLLEGYHHLHCLRIIRQTFWEAVENRPYTYPPSHHMEHCFDALRQAVQCNADNTPLYTFGNFTAGDGQLHQCRDWDELRDYAAKNTACYRDSVEGIPLRDHFGFCDGGKDGLEGAF